MKIRLQGVMAIAKKGFGMQTKKIIAASWRDLIRDKTG